MPNRICEEDVLMFKNDISNIDMSSYLGFTSTLSHSEFRVLFSFLAFNYICDYRTFSDIYFKFYSFKRK